MSNPRDRRKHSWGGSEMTKAYERTQRRCLSRIEKSQFLTDRNVTMSAGGSRSTTIIHWSDGGTSCDGRGAVKPAAAGGGSPQGQALRRLVRRRESEPTDDVVQPVW